MPRVHGWLAGSVVRSGSAFQVFSLPQEITHDDGVAVPDDDDHDRVVVVVDDEAGFRTSTILAWLAFHVLLPCVAAVVAAFLATVVVLLELLASSSSSSCLLGISDVGDKRPDDITRVGAGGLLGGGSLRRRGHRLAAGWLAPCLRARLG